MPSATDELRYLAELRQKLGSESTGTYGATPQSEPEHSLDRRVTEQLQPGNALVYLFATHWRADAIALLSEKTIHIPLSSISSADLNQLASKHYERLDMVHASAHAMSAAKLKALEDRNLESSQRYSDAVRAYKSALGDADANLTDLLGHLWDRVVSGILGALHENEPDYWTLEAPGRIWWCTSGLFSLLPIHAAGYHSTPGKTVIDLTLSSYATSIASWLKTRACAPRAVDDMLRSLIVTSGTESGYSALKNTAIELSIVSANAGASCTVLNGAQSTRAAVLEGLGKHALFHYAGHGVELRTNPQWGGLVLADGLLTAQDIMLTNCSGELAVLSACQSAAPSLQTPDEALHVTSALNLNGFRQVIGSMWPLLDSTAVKLTDLLYTNMLRDAYIDPSMSCEALRSSVLRLRNERGGARPYEWAGVVHFSSA